ncbi:MAG: hypothetical protein JXA44_13270 [Methanospirillaceae archaeon]|nr:hypothetical protein [Methanospirillaceae archaeon]
MPARDRINAQKRDAIPSPGFIASRHDAICSYWDLLAESYPDLFFSEISAALTGKRDPDSDWIKPAFEGLIQKSRYCIDIRGYPAWAL